MGRLPTSRQLVQPSWPMTGLRPVPALRRIPQRLRDRSFWLIQSAVIAITALHVVVERGGLWKPEFGIHHVPVALYVVPIAFSALIYGFEGALLTGLWCMVLIAPNIVLWHAYSLDWLGEEVYAAAIIGAGVVMAWPVEREHRQHLRAEATSARFELLNQGLATLSQPGDFKVALGAVLESLTRALQLEGACLFLREPRRGMTVLACQGNAGERLQELRDVLERRNGGEVLVDGRALVVPLVLESESSGALGVVYSSGRSLTDDDIALLKAAANQFAVTIENARLHQRETEALRSYARLVTTAQEEERKRIARELHDESAMSLVLLCRGLDELGQNGPLSELQAGSVEQLRSIAGGALSDIRRFSRDLRPAMLDKLGLVAALEWLTTEISERSGLGVSLDVTGSPRRLNADVEVAIFRIVQQALHNVERHARASHVVVEAFFGVAEIRVTVTDDGRGFRPPADPEVLVRRRKLGVLGMRERAELIKGALAIESAPGHGTRIVLQVPSEDGAGRLFEPGEHVELRDPA